MIEHGLKISGMTPAMLPLAGTELLPLVQSGKNVQILLSDLPGGAAAAGTLTGTTLAAGVVNSSLTRVGIITTGTWSGLFGTVSGANLTNLTPANISLGIAGISITGNSATATKLATARTINGVPFDGTANITIVTGLANFTSSLATASPNDTVNVASISAAGTGANIGVALVPKGANSFISLSVPDNTAAGGNTRGAGAIDLQLIRLTAAHVASGDGSFVIGVDNVASGAESGAAGSGNSSTGPFSFCFGLNNISGGYSSLAAGYSNNCSGTGCAAIGYGSTVSGEGSVSIGQYNSIGGSGITAAGYSCVSFVNFSTVSGKGTQAYWTGSFSCGYWSTLDGGVVTASSGSIVTTDATPTVLYISSAADRFVLATGQVFTGTALVTGSTAGAASVFSGTRRFTMKNSGGTVSLVSTVGTAGTDMVDAGLSGASVTITADNTNKAIAITVTGVASTSINWRVALNGTISTY